VAQDGVLSSNPSTAKKKKKKPTMQTQVFHKTSRERPLQGTGVLGRGGVPGSQTEHSKGKHRFPLRHPYPHRSTDVQLSLSCPWALQTNQPNPRSGQLNHNTALHAPPPHSHPPVGTENAQKSVTETRQSFPCRKQAWIPSPGGECTSPEGCWGTGHL
jgi:hypothetical protein